MRSCKSEAENKQPKAEAIAGCVHGGSVYIAYLKQDLSIKINDL
jgi:hypothetical protein